MLTDGPPGHIRSDNGHEFIASEIRALFSQNLVDTVYIKPGAPMATWSQIAMKSDSDPRTILKDGAIRFPPINLHR